ncbi:MFS transporter [Erythrobacter sp. SDW2]|uniref:MFS transporter n=1 Tax=Erythrobacter sp. SDW2 TaxID=2907154 RepID=UPI001F2226E5|nr:MFS transporter [Erythrobacter sp. SDW2]UIP06683.1 MFS transporter [Erythrobacter sp. SDW2]
MTPETVSAPAPAAPPLPRHTRWLYGSGLMASGIKTTAFSTYLLLYFNQVLGVPASIVSQAIFLTLLVDAIADPLIGRISDRTRSRLGRRHPFIFAAAIPAGFFFALTWFPPTGLSDFAMGVWIFCLAALTRACMSMFEIPSSALGAELTDDYTERTRLFGIRFWFGYIGAFGFGAFCLAVFFVATPEYPKGQLNPAGYTGFAILGGVLIALAVLTSAFGTKSRIPYLRQVRERAVKLTLGDHLREMADAFTHRPFLAIFGYSLAKQTAIGLYVATTIYFNTYVFQLTAKQLAVLTAESLVAATLAVPLAPWLARRMGKRKAAMAMGLGGICIGVTPLILTYFRLFFAPGDPLLLPVLFAVGAIYHAMIASSLMNSSGMIADTVEDHAVKSGRHNAGVFFSVNSFTTQAAVGLGILLAGFVLDAANFPEQADPSGVSKLISDSLILWYVPITVGLWLLGSLMLLWYPITEAKHRANLDALAARAAQEKEQSLRDSPEVTGMP